MRRSLLVIALAACLLPRAYGQTRYSAAEHADRLSVQDDRVINFVGTDGQTLSVAMTADGRIKVGAFEFSARRLGSDARDAKFEIMIQRGQRRVVRVVSFGGGTARPEESHLRDLSSFLDDFNASSEGVRFQELRRYIVSDVFRSTDEALFTATLDRNTAALHPAMISLWDCTSAILNAAAAAATMVVGCATPSCGPYWGYCCFSGIAWYASALIDVAESCNFEE